TSDNLKKQLSVLPNEEPNIFKASLAPKQQVQAADAFYLYFFTIRQRHHILSSTITFSAQINTNLIAVLSSGNSVQLMLINHFSAKPP
ncbi:MAG: hypothetical protein IJ385_06035, partial [Ruminiclostridium sp.]|nr:hypothetical protein [Ruminiclostridium sp.]